jgi:hypothetical protein
MSSNPNWLGPPPINGPMESPGMKQWIHRLWKREDNRSNLVLYNPTVNNQTLQLNSDQSFVLITCGTVGITGFAELPLSSNCPGKMIVCWRSDILASNIIVRRQTGSGDIIYNDAGVLGPTGVLPMCKTFVSLGTQNGWLVMASF